MSSKSSDVASVASGGAGAGVEEEEEGVTVTVIGGCGFLGQHLVKLLHSHGSNIDLIRVLDFCSFKRELNYQPIRTVQSIVGSIECMEDLMVATAGATTVFHLASFTDRSMFPDDQLHQQTNVEGTRNVIKACQDNGVKNLIYASDIAVVMGVSSILRGNETNTSYPRRHILPDGPSKAEAEKLVLDACGSPLKGIPVEDAGTDSGAATLKTLALRPVNLYGEFDALLWPRVVSLGAFNHGHVPCVGNLKSKVHLMYVGNAAWAFLCAHNALRGTTGTSSDQQQDKDQQQASSSSMNAVLTFALPKGSKKSPKPKGLPESKVTLEDTNALELSLSDVSLTAGPQESPGSRGQVSVEGKAFFICDDTPPVNFFTFMKTFLRRYGFFLTSWTLPEKWAMRIVKLAYVLLWLLFPFLHLNPSVAEGEIRQLCRTYTFSAASARAILFYKPLFSMKESLLNTANFYDQQYKEALSACFIHQAFGSQHLGNLTRLLHVKQELFAVDLGDTGARFRGKVATQENWMRALTSK